ncbi:PA-phosphatase like phosphoesterase [Paraburkholderia piptadeniae]|uniref:PA-phosphatase like phosphoesterase n=1 Tax=Paraburkholderia piptadeniae TaxID=1701573 RepID=A0A1N7S6U4_9BURK|nr:phosphatase PAP2 family protein [Paraburkholderia piptadeniae]SIT43049.1 PA-phosphatase like phosphoesterase [Paraburkholderia piptadeniae]
MPHLPYHLWYLITSFGGAGLTLPLAFAIALWLAVGYSWKLAAGWLFLLGVAVALVTATKVAFLGWGVGVRVWDFTGLSGHAMLATAVYPVAAFLVLLPAPPAMRVAGVALALFGGALVSFSRVVIEAHSPSEAITGCIVGALTALVFIRIAWNATPGRVSIVPVALSLMFIALGLHNVHVPTHRWVTHLALKVSGHDRPFVRGSWRPLRDTSAPDTPFSPLPNTRNVAVPLQNSDA